MFPKPSEFRFWIKTGVVGVLQRPACGVECSPAIRKANPETVGFSTENKGRFYHDGRFPTLLDAVTSYNTRFTLGLTDQEKLDLVEYLKSL